MSHLRGVPTLRAKNTDRSAQRRRGRPRKVYGTPYVGPRGERIRLAEFTLKERHLFKPAPRGKTGAAHFFPLIVKEWSPFVYAFAVEELRKSAGRDPDLQRILDGWRGETRYVGTPTAREFAA